MLYSIQSSSASVRSTSRRTFYAVILTRAGRDLRGFVTRFRHTRLGRLGSLLLLITTVAGISATPVWSFLGIPWWVGVTALVLSVVALRAVAALEAGLYHTWRDLEENLKPRGGMETRVVMSPYGVKEIPNTNAVVVTFPRANDRSRVVRAGNKTRMPIAVRFERPRSRKIVRSSDSFPVEIKVRDGLRRHRLTIYNFVEGGFVFDDRDTPLNGEWLRCEIHFPSPVDAGAKNQ